RFVGDLELAPEQRTALREPQGDLAGVRSLDVVPWIEEEAGEHTQDGDLLQQAVEHLDPGVLLLDEEDLAAGGVGDLVGGPPQGLGAKASHRAQHPALGVGEGEAGGPVEDAVGVDLIELVRLGAVREDPDLVLELEDLLPDVEDLVAGGVADVDLRRQGRDLEAQLEGKQVHGRSSLRESSEKRKEASSTGGL